MKINTKNNFIRIFKIPHEYPKGYCFGGGKDVNFIMVDWFEPYPVMAPPVDIPNASKSLVPLLDCPNNEIELTPELREKLNSMLREFISKKKYSDGCKLLAITNYGDSFIINP